MDTFQILLRALVSHFVPIFILIIVLGLFADKFYYDHLKKRKLCPKCGKKMYDSNQGYDDEILWRCSEGHHMESEKI